MDEVVLAPEVRVALDRTGFSVRWTAETGSTNADLLAEARSGAADRSVLVADHQRAGRGRLGRTWEAPVGSSLLISILVRPGPPAERVHLLASAVAIAAAQACEDLAGVRPGLKWPNDLVIGDGDATRKLGGILAESLVSAGVIEAVVVGLGCNVRWPDELPEELRTIATSLDRHSAHQVERADLAVALLGHLGPLLDSLGEPNSWTRTADRYRSRCSTLGQRVRVERTHDALVGVATDIDDEGALVLRDAEGVVHHVTVGDVVHLRPAS